MISGTFPTLFSAFNSISTGKSAGRKGVSIVNSPSSKLSFRCEGEINTFSDKENHKCLSLADLLLRSGYRKINRKVMMTERILVHQEGKGNNRNSRSIYEGKLDHSFRIKWNSYTGKQFGSFL